MFSAPAYNTNLLLELEQAKMMPVRLDVSLVLLFHRQEVLIVMSPEEAGRGIPSCSAVPQEDSRD